MHCNSTIYIFSFKNFILYFFLYRIFSFISSSDYSALLAVQYQMNFQIKFCKKNTSTTVLWLSLNLLWNTGNCSLMIQFGSSNFKFKMQTKSEFVVRSQIEIISKRALTNDWDEFSARPHIYRLCGFGWPTVEYSNVKGKRMKSEWENAKHALYGSKHSSIVYGVRCYILSIIQHMH